MRFINRWVRGCHAQELTGLQFSRKSGRGEEFLCLSWVDVCASIISSFSRLGRGVFLSLCSQTKSINYRFLFFMCREHVLGIINFPELTGQDVCLMPPLFYCLGAYLSCFGCMVLLLSNPAWFCGSANLLSWVIITSQGLPYFLPFFLLTIFQTLFPN